jgi:bifunctional DNA-binding transcriptional regulator/antitoxin component of YhaV-PrlF toxin-antitoxin module
MAKVGTKYQVVIGREARRRLGIEPGWVAVEAIVGDHLELRFLPPEHGRSLAGDLGRYAGGVGAPEPAEEEERAAWEAHVEEEWGS